MKNIETKFADLRIDNDLTQKDISKKLDVSRSTYSKWEIEANDLDLEMCNKIANFYKVNLDYLLGISNISTKTEKNKINFNLLCNRLRNLRKENNLTQEELGNKIGFAQSTYACYEKGVRIPTTFKLLYIAKYYNVSFDYLVGRSDNRVIQKGK